MIKTETILKPNKIENSELSVLIFKCENADVCLLEKTMLNWVKDAVSAYETHVVNFNPNKPEFNQIKSNLAKTKYMLVLYSFNPLLTTKNINLCIDYAVLRGETLVKLPFGYVFETNYFNGLTEIKEPLVFNADASEFLKISSQTEIGYATEVLSRRILQNLILNGVNIINPASVVINANCKVEKNVTIYPFNTLSGKTIIKSGAILKEGNTITNSEISENVAVANSIISNSKIGADSVIFPFNTIENKSVIGANCVIKSYNKLNNVKVGDNTSIESFNDIGN